MATHAPNDPGHTRARTDRDAPSGAAPAGLSAGANPHPPVEPAPPDPAGTLPPHPAAPAALGGSGPYVPGFVITGEIARGGMGVVLTAREVALGRDVAIKMLAPGARGAERAVYRFVEEARITARLQHPGIPPIYQVGALADGRPYLSMKLIRGRTLGAILTAREQRPSSRSADELDLTALDSPGLLQIFEQICQAVGYAHARGVVHRDLKPANVMVGSFGEVQVMDWGLAKARGPNGAVACAADGATATADATPPDAFSAPNAEATLVGHAMGTPQYMPPEQACGAWERVDARADVFALGGILTAILTGLPPYTDPTREAVLRRAVACDLAGCIARLDECGADADLIDLAKWCLAPDPDDRPADGAEVARQVAAYRLSVGARLIAAETDRAAAAARAEEARLRAATERLAKRAAEERSVLAEWFADEVRTRAGETARRRRGVFVAVVFVLLVLSGLYGDYRERKGRAAVAPPPPPPACGAAGCGAGHE